MQIVTITDNESKKTIAERVLRGLPKWFGIEQSLVEYVESLDDKEFFAAKDADGYIGFFAVDYINEDAADLYVLGIMEKYHNRGIGTQFIAHIEKHLKARGVKYLTVQTLSSKSADENYAKTRMFYEKMGFTAVYMNDEIWGEGTPFQLMVKYLGAG